MLDGTEGRCACSSTVSTDEYDVGVSLGHTGRNRSYSDFRDQLHCNSGMRIDVLKVVDQLGEIFDRVDVVVRWRRDQSHAGDRVPQPRDDLVHLMSGKLPTLTGLRALGHF